MFNSSLSIVTTHLAPEPALKGLRISKFYPQSAGAEISLLSRPDPPPPNEADTPASLKGSSWRFLEGDPSGDGDNHNSLRLPPRPCPLPTLALRPASPTQGSSWQGGIDPIRGAGGLLLVWVS